MEAIKYTIADFKIGDEIWWFQATNSNKFCHTNKITADGIELVHDIVHQIRNNLLFSYFGIYEPQYIWGKTREEAWLRLKSNIENWGKFDDQYLQI